MRPLLWGEVRRRWRGAAVMGLLFGVGFAVALGSAAGARRTASAYPRMLRATNAPQLIVGGEDSSPAARQRVYDRVAKVPGVGSMAAIAGVQLVPIGVPRNAGVASESCTNMALDGQAWHRVGAPNILSGRLPDAGRSDEILVSRSYVDTYGVRVGDRLTLVAPQGDGASADRVTAADGPAVAVTVVGVGSFATDVLPVSDLDAAPTSIGERALLDRIAPDSGDWCYDGVFLTLAPGARVKPVVGALEAIGDDILPFVQDLTANYAEVRRAIQPQVTALWLFSVVAGLATLLLAGQLLTRQLQHSAAVSAPVWRALGAGRRQVVALVAAPCAVTAGVAGITAAAGAVALSGRFPIGPARLAETAPGVRLDAPVQFGGGVVVAAASLVIGLAAAILVVRRRGAARAPIVARLSAVASRPAVVVGVHLATDAGQGDRTVPVRSAVAGTALCVAAILSTVTFADGLQTLVSKPSNYGQDWDVMVDSAFGLAPAGAVLDELGRDPAVVAVAGGRYGTVTIGGTDVPAIGLADLRGTTFPAIIKGRRAVRSDEIVLGERSLRATGHSIGDRIDVSTGGRPVEMTIVGTAAFPRLNMGSFSTLGLGQGAVLRADAFPPRGLPEEADAPPNFVARDYQGPGGGLYEFVTLRLRAGAAAGDRRRVLAAANELPGHGAYVIRTEQRPVAIANYAAVRSTPVVLATLLSLMAAATLAHVLGSAVRRRRRDLALCAVLGMDRRQLSASVLIQAVLVSGAALAVGLPLGIAGGRVAWGGFASELGVPDRLLMPLGAIVLMVPAVVVAAGVVALVPAVIASRTPRAVTLRTE